MASASTRPPSAVSDASVEDPFVAAPDTCATDAEGVVTTGVPDVAGATYATGAATPSASDASDDARLVLVANPADARAVPEDPLIDDPLDVSVLTFDDAVSD